jgi:hypothetical protein
MDTNQNYSKNYAHTKDYYLFSPYRKIHNKQHLCIREPGLPAGSQQLRIRPRDPSKIKNLSSFFFL